MTWPRNLAVGRAPKTLPPALAPDPAASFNSIWLSTPPTTQQAQLIINRDMWGFWKLESQMAQGNSLNFGNQRVGRDLLLSFGRRQLPIPYKRGGFVAN